MSNDEMDFMVLNIVYHIQLLVPANVKSCFYHLQMNQIPKDEEVNNDSDACDIDCCYR